MLIFWRCLMLAIGGILPQTQVVSAISTISDLEWTKQCVATYPELNYLIDENVKKTGEGNASDENPYSVQYSGRKCIEFDRCLLSLRSSEWFIQGDEESYKKLTAAQQENKLSWESFKTLHRYATELLESSSIPKNQMLEAIYAALILGDMGKSPQARQLFPKITNPDHDLFYKEAMEELRSKPHLLPTYEKLSPLAKDLLFRASRMPHLGHIYHLEGELEMLEPIKIHQLLGPNVDPTPFLFEFFIHCCDVCGALGHVNHRSSIAFTEHTFMGKEAVREALLEFKDPLVTSYEVYQTLLKKRATFIGLEKESDFGVFARLAAMMRLFIPPYGETMRIAFVGLSVETKDRLRQQLTVGLTPKKQLTDTYVPAVYVNLLNNKSFGDTFEIRLSKVISIAVPFVTQVQEHHLKLLSEGIADPSVPLEFNALSALAKEPNAEQYFMGTFVIDAKGTVRPMIRA